MKAVKRYACGSCGHVHKHEDAAIECCAPEVDEVWACGECGHEHDLKSQAEACCMQDRLLCPGCCRPYYQGQLDHTAVRISGHCTVCIPLFSLEQIDQVEQLHHRETGRFVSFYRGPQ